MIDATFIWRRTARQPACGRKRGAPRPEGPSDPVLHDGRPSQWLHGRSRNSGQHTFGWLAFGRPWLWWRRVQRSLERQKYKALHLRQEVSRSANQARQAPLQTPQ